MKSMVNYCCRKFLYILIFSFIFLHYTPVVKGQSEIDLQINTIKKFIFNDYRGMLKESNGSLKFPFISPGSSQYSNELWDWDSWLSNVALRQITSSLKIDDVETINYEQGCVLNFLNYGGLNGWIPHLIYPELESRDSILSQRNVFSGNMHKPVLAQHAAFLIQQGDGNAEWIREQFYYLQSFVNAYLNYYRHRPTGLLFWQNDGGIGVDNDPSTFFRPNASSGSIFLNCLMYKELKATVYIAKCLNQAEIAVYYEKQAYELKNAIRQHCWDKRDGFYYSVDLNLLDVKRPEKSNQRHIGGPRNWDCLIQRIGVWSGFCTLWAGIATAEEAELVVKKHYSDTSSFNAPFGVRTLSKHEKMYNVNASGNPSNWLGPVWIVSNYLTFRGLVQYGYTKEARELVKKTIRLLANDFSKNGALHEYYLPESGEPVLNKGFQNWNYLVLNMISWYKGEKPVVEF